MRQLKVGLLFVLSICSIATSGSAAAQAYGAVAAPIYVPGLQHQFYVGYQRANSDYGLVTSGGVVNAVSGGLDAQFRYHATNDHLALVGAVRYVSGSLLGQKWTTGAAGIVYVASIGRYAPFVQVLGGMSRLTSTDTMYLQSGPQTGFTTLAGVGLDINVTSHFGLRPVYLEEQYLPSFGPKGSAYWNAGAGVFYQFSSFGHNR